MLSKKVVRSQIGKGLTPWKSTKPETNHSQIQLTLQDKLDNYFFNVTTFVYDDFNVKIENFKKIIRENAKPAQKTNHTDNEVIKYCLNQENILIIKILLRFFFRKLDSLSTFQEDFLPLAESLRNLITFIENECCQDKTYYPLNAEIIGINYNEFWCALAMHGFTQYLKNPALEKDNSWMLNYENYKRLKLSVKTIKPIWLDYEKAMLGYQYLSEAKTFFIKGNTKAGFERLEKAENEVEEARQIHNLIVIKNQETKLKKPKKRKIPKQTKKYGSGYGRHYECAALYLYHELYSFYQEFNLQDRLHQSLSKSASICLDVEICIQSLETELKSYESQLKSKTTKERLRKKLEQRQNKDKKKNNNKKLWNEKLAEYIGEVNSHIIFQKYRFQQWQMTAEKHEQKKGCERLHQLQKKLQVIEDLLKADDIQTLFSKVERNDNQLTLLCVLDSNTNPNILSKSLFLHKIKFSIKRNSNLEILIIFNLNDEVDINTLKNALENYTTQLNQFNEQNARMQSHESHMAMLRALLPSTSSATKEESQQDTQVNESLIENIRTINEQLREQRAASRNPTLYSENIKAAEERAQSAKKCEEEELAKKERKIANLNEKRLEKERERLEASKLKHAGSEEIYDNTKLLIAFNLLKKISKKNEIDDDEKHIMLGCLLHIISEIKFRLIIKNTYYSYDKAQKKKLKPLIKQIRNTFMHNCFDADADFFKSVATLVTPLKVLFHKNYYMFNSKISNTPFETISKAFDDLSAGIKGYSNRLTINESLEQDVFLLNNIIFLLNDFLHDKRDADEASFLCLGMIVKIQEHINYFSNQFKEKYSVQLKQFKSDRNQIIHRENDSSLFYNQRDIYNWEKLFEIKATHASALLQSLLEIKQELLVNSQPLTNISYKK